MCIRDRVTISVKVPGLPPQSQGVRLFPNYGADEQLVDFFYCLLYTSDAADERSSVDLGGRRIIKKKNNKEQGGGDLVTIDSIDK